MDVLGLRGFRMIKLLEPDCQPRIRDVVLSVSPIESDQRALQAILAEWPAPHMMASTIEDALPRLLHTSTALMLCDRDLPDGNWKLLFQQTQALPSPPRCIVFSRLADEYLWAEVLNLGGQDVLQTPFVAREVRHVVDCAWHAWHHQRAPITTRQMPAPAASRSAITGYARAIGASLGISEGGAA